jgi:hypothetical protein
MKSIKTAVLIMILGFGLKAKADGLYDITFSDPGTHNVGFGQIDVVGGFAVSGYFDVTAGLAIGNYTLYTAGGTGTWLAPILSPTGKFQYDNVVYSGSNPQYPVTNPIWDNGGVLFTGTGNKEVNLWGNADGSYSFDAYVNNAYLDNTGIVGGSTIMPAPEPPSLGFITLMLVPAGMFVLNWRKPKL